MRIVRRNRTDSKVELQMTAMIDVVFQLLIFFMLSFKIVAMEGEFRVQPSDDTGTASPLLRESLPLRLRLSADDRGQLAHIQLNGDACRDWDELRRHIVQLVHPHHSAALSAADWEIELESDASLLYEHVVAAITAVHGYVDEQGRVVPLVQKINFARRGESSRAAR